VQRRDAVIPGVLAVLSTVELLGLGVDHPAAPIALQVGVCALLVLRRRWPWAVPTAAAVLSALMPYLGTELDEPAVPILILGLALWTTGRHLPDLRGIASVALVMLVVLSDLSREPAGFDITDVAFISIILVPPYLAGLAWRTLEARNRRLSEQAAELLRLQDLVRQEAAAAERGRIARELHDVIAHSVSAMVVQASAASSLIASDPARATPAVDDVASTGRQALAETGRLLHLLRDDSGELGLAPDAGMDRLADLVEEQRRNGLYVDLAVEGPLAGLPAGLGLSAYRIVQEALTNALKHSADRRVRLQVNRCERQLRVRVENAVGPRGPSSGLGLVGMAERVSVFGGTLEHGVTGGRFVLEAAPPLPGES
jgi:signal transduction histidine kinase